MANTGRTTTRRHSNNARNGRGVYVDGNTARRLQEVPARRGRPPQARPAGDRTKTAKTRETVQAQAARQNWQLSREAQRNREKAMNMNRGFVVFLSVISVAVLMVCVNFIQLKSQVTAQIKAVASLESELADLKEDNDAYESQVTSNVDLNEIKKIAIGRLGMQYPTEDQKMTYQTAASSYVRQYQDIPETK